MCYATLPYDDLIGGETDKNGGCLAAAPCLVSARLVISCLERDR